MAGDTLNDKINANDTLNGKINDILNGKINLSEKEKAILRVISENPSITYPEMAAQLSIFFIRTISRAINKLQNEGLIVREGSKKSGYWEVQ